METERPPAPASFSSSSAEVQVRVDSGTAHNNAIHPVNIDTPQLAFPCPVAYREVKHLKKWKPWLIYGIVVANVVVFIITMYVNNCPKNSVSCIARFLGRFSFEPFRENPLLGPSATTLLNMGALQVILVLDGHQAWRLVTCNWLHAGVFHILANMLGLVIIGIRLEQEFGFVKIGLVYVISGFGGSLLSALFIQSGISVGASGALFGLLGALLSELIINWSIYSGKVSAFILLLIMIVTNLAMGILPHVDNFAHIGGFLSGFLLGFVFLIRPQFGWYTQRYTPTEYTSASVVPKFKLYQCILWIISVVFLVAGYTVGLIMLLRGVNANDHCSWCHYLSCVPTAKWSCSQTASCMSNQIGNQLNITCTANGRSGVYELPNTTSRQMRVICAQLCS